jgi:rubrerythrin
MSKPMSDGGKGSVRRNEDNEAYQCGWDAIFGKGKKTMMNEDPQRSEDYEEQSDEDTEWTCDSCGGPMYRQPHWGYGQCDDCGARQELEDGY